MFCSGCVHVLDPGQAFCPQCNRAAAPPVAPVAAAVEYQRAADYQRAGYASRVRVLGILWLVYAGFSLVKGFVGIAFAHAFFSGGFAPWIQAPAMPQWLFPAALHFLWLAIVVRVVLAAVAGWGLMERTEWGRIVAIVAAILSLFHLPLGTALGIGTLIMLLGARNWSLYEQP
jgi:hypothetical protein